MLPVIKYYKIWFAFSGTLVTLSLILLLTWGLKPGIEFRGGSLAELEFSKTVATSEIKQKLQANGFADVVVQPVSENTAIIKTETLDERETEEFRKLLEENFGQFKELRFESIGPTISRELVRRAYWQIILVCLGILFYLAYAFRGITKQSTKIEVSPWRLGLAAIIALIHDILITVGVFVVLGRFAGVEVDSLFVTALLTILGFSVHDTIVVFDRIRENLQVHKYSSLPTIVEYSINSTLARSVNTSSTLIFVLVALLLFGGQTIFYFVLALLVGVSIGTYSSIFVASPLLHLWRKRL